jgi:hypothetical protein
MKARRWRTRKNKKPRKASKVRKTRIRKQRGGTYMGFDPVKQGQYTTVLDRELSDTPMLMPTEEYLAEKESQ